MTTQTVTYSEEEAYRAKIREQYQTSPIVQKSNPKKKWYKKPWFIIFCLIFVQPVGLILMWKYATWNKTAKWIITAVVGSMYLLNLYHSFFEKKAEPTTVVTQSEIGRYAYNATNGVYIGKIINKKPCNTLPELECYVTENKSRSRNLESPVSNVIVKDTQQN